MTNAQLRAKFQEFNMQLGDTDMNRAKIDTIDPPFTDEAGQPLPVQAVLEVFERMTGPRLSET